MTSKDDPNSHTNATWRKVIASCEGEPVLRHGEIWKFCDLTNVDSMLDPVVLGNFLDQKFSDVWERLSETTGLVRISSY